MTNDIPLGTGASLAPGQIKFYDARLPPLSDGTYQLHWSQQVHGVGTEPIAPYTGAQDFRVQGPRFTLPPDQVQSVYPPANAAGNFTDTMPHIVLSRATLPWERSIDATAPATAGTPWLALLSFTAEELAGAAPAAITVTELLTPTQAPGKTILAPAIPAASLTPGDLAGKLNAIDLPIAAWTGIAPTLAEVPYLAHAREINTDGKEILGINENGVYAVVIGNRLVPSGRTRSEAYTVLLVSLEGHAAHLPSYAGAGTTGPTGCDAIRLPVLASWGFTAAAHQASFSELMQALPRRGGVGLLQYPHGAFGADDAGIARTALDIGFAPLANNTRAGEGTTSWYRGPLAPVPTDPAAVGPVAFGDAAIRYDPKTGLFDASYAAAWQIGRLLALADASFARTMMAWRRDLQRSNCSEAKRMSLAGRLPDHPALQALAAPTAGPSSAPAPAVAVRQAVVQLVNQAADARAAAGEANVPACPKVALRSQRGDGLLPGKLPDAEFADLLASGEDPLAGLARRLLKEPQ
ncbi:hypothetical protein [Methylobacterium indicum]|uniref:hypothetical protein n=1 Tax=Methylobacterium indicum TaxID=1775910 RepID=UPI00065484F1|nr:hypothetical protein [Methylobacterium indicum]